MISITPNSNDLPPATPDFLPKEVQKNDAVFEEKPSEIAERLRKEQEEEKKEVLQPEIPS